MGLEVAERLAERQRSGEKEVSEGLAHIKQLVVQVEQQSRKRIEEAEQSLA